MRVAIAVVATAAVAISLVATAAPVSASSPSGDDDLTPSLHCVRPMAIPEVQNVFEAKWSPDGAALAISWFAKLPSSRYASGYVEQEVTDTLDLRTGALRPLGVGDEPRWSGTGRYLSYWGPGGEELRVTQNARTIARLEPSIPETRWVGDALVFIEKAEIREWRDGAVRTLARIADAFVPKYPRDDVYFSADGAAFTLTRYSPGGTTARFVGTTATGEVAPLDAAGARYLEWAPAGRVLLVRYLDRLELRERGTVTRSVPLPSAGTVHAWAPDGRTLLLGRVSPTVPGGDALDGFRAADAPAGAAIATLPNVLGERTFSPDGRYFVGVGRTGTQTTRLEVYRCGGAATPAPGDPDAGERLAHIASAPGRFVRPAAGEISQFLQGIHTGVDVAAPFGSLITADDDGVVSSVESVAVGGDRVCVRHAGALESCYYHTSAPLVRVGEAVVRGQPVALVGMTGVTTGPHTHWEVKLAGRIVDPLTY